MRKLFAEIKWINFLYLTVLGLINSIGVTMFLAPVNLYDSGISGTSILPLYSIVAYFVALKTIDFVVEGFDRSKAAMVVTSRPDKVASALSDAFYAFDKYQFCSTGKKIQSLNWCFSQENKECHFT